MCRSFVPAGRVNFVAIGCTRSSALKPKFSGPYTVMKKLSDTNYLIRTPDRRRKSRLVHVNMIKSYVKDESVTVKPSATVAFLPVAVEDVFEPVLCAFWSIVKLHNIERLRCSSKSLNSESKKGYCCVNGRFTFTFL